MSQNPFTNSPGTEYSAFGNQLPQTPGNYEYKDQSYNTQSPQQYQHSSFDPNKIYVGQANQLSFENPQKNAYSYTYAPISQNSQGLEQQPNNNQYLQAYNSYHYTDQRYNAHPQQNIDYGNLYSVPASTPQRTELKLDNPQQNSWLTLLPVRDQHYQTATTYYQPINKTYLPKPVETNVHNNLYSGQTYTKQDLPKSNENPQQNTNNRQTYYKPFVKTIQDSSKTETTKAGKSECCVACELCCEVTIMCEECCRLLCCILEVLSLFRICL